MKVQRLTHLMKKGQAMGIQQDSENARAAREAREAVVHGAHARDPIAVDAALRRHLAAEQYAREHHPNERAKDDAAAAGVDVEDVLVQQRAEVLDDALAALGRSHLVHYEQSGEEVTRERLDELFDLVVGALRSRQLGPVSRYCEELAQQRFEAGFGISEVQTAFNVLEEAMWRRVVVGVQPSDLAEAIGLLSTILGFGKDVLARRYVSLASQRHVPSLDLSALFAGIEN